MEDKSKIKILFVCTGNICRSPLAEAVFKHLIKDRYSAATFFVDSAGTENYHVGSSPDLRALVVAKKQGVAELNHLARQFKAQDFERFDYILVMDHLNYDAVINQAQNAKQQGKVMLFRTFDPEVKDFYDVPDPYYGIEADFVEVGEIIRRSSLGFLNFLVQEGRLKKAGT